MQGDAPAILDAALAGHNAFLAGEPEPESAPAPPSGAATTRDVRSAAASTGAASTGAASTRAASTRAASIRTASTGTGSAETTSPGASADDTPTVVLPEGGATPPPPVAGTGYTTSDGTLPPGGGHPRSVTDYADRLDDTRFFSTLFDFSFTGYVTRKLAGPVYVVGLVLIALSTLLSLIYSLTIAVQTHSFYGAFVFLFGVIITLVGTVLAVLLLRVGIEVFVAIIEIAQNTRGGKKERP